MRAILLIVATLSLSACIMQKLPSDKTDLAEAARIRNAIALQYLQMGDPGKAESELNAAIKLDSHVPQIYNSLGLVYEDEHDPRNADKNYRKALWMDRHNGQFNVDYGSFLFRQGRFSEACEHFHKAADNLDYDRRDAAFENLGLCYEQQHDLTKAGEYLQRALSLNGKLPVATIEYADVLFEQGDTVRAARGYARFLVLIQGHPQSARSLWLGIRLARLHGDDATVASYAKTLQQLYPQSPEYALYQQSLNAQHP